MTRTKYPRKLPSFNLYSIRSSYGDDDRPEARLQNVVIGLLEMMPNFDEWTFEEPNKYVHQTGIWFSPAATFSKGSDYHAEIVLGVPKHPDLFVSFYADYQRVSPIPNIVRHFEIIQAAKTIEAMALVVQLAVPVPE